MQKFLRNIALIILLLSLEKHTSAQEIKAWTDSQVLISINYPDVTEAIIDSIIDKHRKSDAPKNPEIGDAISSAKKLKEASLGKILEETRI